MIKHCCPHISELVDVGGFDGPIHISEEASNASTVVPWAIVSSIGIAAILGWGELSFNSPRAM